MHFCRMFADERLYKGRSAKGATHRSFHREFLNNCLGKVSMITYINISSRIPRHCIFAKILPRISARCSTKGALLIPNFVEHFLLQESSTYKQFVLALSFCWFFADSKLYTRHSTIIIIINFILIWHEKP